MFIKLTMKKLAIVGVTGLVGQTLLSVLKEEGLLGELELFMFVSDRSAGNFLNYNNNSYLLRELTDEIFEMDLDYAIFLTGEDISFNWAKRLAESGVVVIDNSSAFRMNRSVPLIVPEINFDKISSEDKLIANPNCSTIQLVLVLDILRRFDKIKKVIVSSYQSVSGAGRDALMDLEHGSNKVFSIPIRDNFIPMIGSFFKNGNCSEEEKIIKETQKILEERFEIFASAVRIPIRFCHGESVYIEFDSHVDIESVRKKIEETEYLKFSEDLFYASECAGTNFSYVCRLRKAGINGVQLFIIADNLRRGAAYNAVKILKKLLER